MDLGTRRADGFDLLVLPVARLDADVVPEFKAAFSKLELCGGPLVVDLAAVEFIDSMGVGALLGCMRRQHERGSTMRLCGVQPTVGAIFTILKLSRVFEVYDTCADAAGGRPAD
jgi:anti-sigma B factor antagonist